MTKIPKVLFLSKGNASRAEIAEAYMKFLAGDRFASVSAATEDAGVNPLAFEVMREAGVEVAAENPRELASIFRESFRYVVTICDEPSERYPLYPFTPNLLKRAIANPEFATGGPEEKKQAFRKVRDQIKRMVEELIETIGRPDRTLANAA